MKHASIRAMCGIMGLALIMTACGPQPPSEEELRSRIVGTYCAANYRLVLTDSTYHNRKVVESPLRSGLMRESCQGNYLLVFEDNAWTIRFTRDERPNSTFHNCEKEFVLWDREKGYLGGDEQTVMPDLFDEKELVKGSCDD